MSLSSIKFIWNSENKPSKRDFFPKSSLVSHNVDVIAINFPFTPKL